MFAWSDKHLHSFHIHDREYGSSGASTRSVLLRDLGLRRGERFRYVGPRPQPCENRVLPISLPDISPRPAGCPAVRSHPQDLFGLHSDLYIL